MEDAVGRKIKHLEGSVTWWKNRANTFERENVQLKQTLHTLAALKDAVLQAADYLDPHRYDDD